MKRIKIATVKKPNGKVYRYQYFRSPTKGGKLPKLTLLKSDDPGAEAEALLQEFYRLSEHERLSALSKHACTLIRAAKKRSVLKKVAFDLLDEMVITMLVEQDYRCAITGIPFDLWQTGKRKTVRRLPMRPSLDRKEPKLGYVAGNVRIVCTAANMALNEWGEDVFQLIAEGFLRTKRHGRLANPLENPPTCDSDARLSA